MLVDFSVEFRQHLKRLDAPIRILPIDLLLDLQTKLMILNRLMQLPFFLVVNIPDLIQHHNTILTLIAFNVLEDVIATFIYLKRVFMLIQELIDTADVMVSQTHVVMIVTLLFVEVLLLWGQLLFLLGGWLD